MKPLTVGALAIVGVVSTTWIAVRAQDASGLPVAAAVAAVLTGFVFGFVTRWAAQLALAVCCFGLVEGAYRANVGLLVIPVLVGALASPQLRRRAAARVPVLAWVLVALLVVPTVVLYWLQADAELQFVVGIVTLCAGGLLAWAVFARTSAVVTGWSMIVVGSITAAAYVAFAVTRLREGESTNAWVAAYSNGVWVNANTLGAAFGVLLAVSLGYGLWCETRALRNAALLSVPLLAVAVYLSFSRSALLSAAVVIIFAVGMRARWIALPLAVLTAMGTWSQSQQVGTRLAYTYAGGALDSSSATRIALWGDALGGMFASPLGSGPLAAALVDQAGDPFPYAHNLWLSTALRFGILAGAALIAATMLTARWVWRRRRTGPAARAALLTVASVVSTSLFGESMLTLELLVPVVAVLACSSRSGGGESVESSGNASGWDRQGRALVLRPGARPSVTRS